MGYAVAAGLLLGAVYTLSPLLVVSAAALLSLARWAGHGLTPRERQWMTGVLVVAIAIRVAAVAALFAVADSSAPYANFFGDEEFFKLRTIWMRNIGLGLPVAASDYIYTYDEVGQTSYVSMLAYLQAIVGESPYGLHLLNIALYVAASLGLYRLVRPAFGGLVAMGGLALLLFLPSLYIWSISALKEPLYMLVAAGGLACAVQIVRAPQGWQKVLAVGGVIAGALVLQSLRNGGIAVGLLGAAAGLAASVALTKPRVLLAAMVLVPIIGLAAFSRPMVQDVMASGVRLGARYHAGHVLTPGHTYELLDRRYYEDRPAIQSMPAPEMARFVSRAIVSYFTVPLPWNIESRAMLAYLPEQMLWYVLVALVPVGFVAGLRRDALLTCLLASHAVAVVMMVALTSGNVGTLVRHRGLALPYLVWLAALGAYAVADRLLAVRAASEQEATSHAPR